MQKKLKYNIRTLRKRTLVLFLLVSMLLPFFAITPQYTPELHAADMELLASFLSL